MLNIFKCSLPDTTQINQSISIVRTENDGKERYWSQAFARNCGAPDLLGVAFRLKHEKRKSGIDYRALVVGIAAVVVQLRPC